MGATSAGSESEPDSSVVHTPPEHVASSPHLSARLVLILAMVSTSLACRPPVTTDALDRVQASGRLTFGADEEGGAPYFFKDGEGRRIGFEAELMEKVGKILKVEPELYQGQWEYLLPGLERGEMDAVVNGYELTAERASDYLPTRPYYVYQLQLMALRGGPVHSWADFEKSRPGGGRWKVAVLGLSAAHVYAQKFEGSNLEVIVADGATNAMMAVCNGVYDATLQDLPAARHYIKLPEFRDLAIVGPPLGCGYYVIYTRKRDPRLRDAIDRAIAQLVDSGELRVLYEKYDIWNDAQDLLKVQPTPLAQTAGPKRPAFNFDLLIRFGPNLLLAALTTIVLSFTAMPLAMVIGLLVAIGRVYGPWTLRKILGVYVELVRGTPLILQLYLLFYVLPKLVGITLTPWAAGVAGLAINYSAYEAEIWRAGLQAISKGQMEAALALGMSPALAIRRVIVPQAVRIVIPPVTSDFIAMFKDTSVCSVIMLTELTKTYSILFNSQGGVVEFGLATAALYMAMSLPLSWFSRWVERRMDAEPRKGVIG